MEPFSTPAWWINFTSFLAPKFIGGRQAPGILGGLGIARLEEARLARHLSIHRLGPDILISGYLNTCQ